MAERNQKVLERVRQELNKNPAMGSKELYGIARDFDKTIGQDTLQQFHARYVLPFKRGKGAAKKTPKRARRARKAAAVQQNEAPTRAARQPRARPAASGGFDRERVRSVLLDFARDFAGAESRSEIVQMLSRVDEYVDRIVSKGS